MSLVTIRIFRLYFMRRTFSMTVLSKEVILIKYTPDESPVVFTLKICWPCKANKKN
jgi:hypothetical protein